MGKSVGKERRRGRLGLWALFGVLLVVAAGGVGLLGLSNRTLTAPDWLRARIETRLNDRVEGFDLELGAVNLVFDENWQPDIGLSNLILRDESGRQVMRFDDMRTKLDLSGAMRGTIKPTSLRLRAVELSFERKVDGSFSLTFGESPGIAGSSGSLAEMINSVEEIFELSALKSIETIEGESLSLFYRDERSGQAWNVSDGRFLLTRSASGLSASLGVQLATPEGERAQLAVSLTSEKGSLAAQIGANVINLAARDAAQLSPALSWLGVLEAPISGALRAEIDEAGALGRMNGTLDIGQGALHPTEETKPIPFRKARAYFSYDPETLEIVFNELSVNSEVAAIKAEGKAYLRDMVDGWPETLLGQFRFRDITLNPEGVFETPVAFESGAIDMRLQLDPFTLTLGQFVLTQDVRKFLGKGNVRAAPEGWDAALDLSLNETTADQLMAIWPVAAVVKTRKWMAENVFSGKIYDVSAAFRLRPGQAPINQLNFKFRDGTVRFLKSMPPIETGRGYGMIEGRSLTMVVEQGVVQAPEGFGPVDIAGSVLRIPDIRIKPAPATISLKTDSSIAAILSLLDQPPFNLMSKAGRAVDLAQGRATLAAEIDLFLAKWVRLPDVSFDVTGQLRDVSSEKLLRGRKLTAPLLEIAVSGDGMQISGAGKLGILPFQASWQQGFAPGETENSRVEGNVELSRRFVDEFNINLPAGSVSGEGVARIEIDLAKSAPAEFILLSDLNRVGLSIPSLGWSKAKAARGRLQISGTLSDPPVIDALNLEAAGLKARGSVSFTPEGRLQQADFPTVSLDRWFNAPVKLLGNGDDHPATLSIQGGTLDLRRASFGTGRSGDGGTAGGGTGGGGPIQIALDRLILSDSIYLSGFEGSFKSLGGFNGSFSGRVNGSAPVTGTVVTLKDGIATRIRAKDAGAVFRATGLLSGAARGALEVILSPLGPKGSYAGRLEAKNLRLRDAPALAELLGALSIVGLLEQLDGNGILFTSVEGDFTLTPKNVQITRASAVGPSLGVTMEGVYNPGSRRMNVQGVLSPVYFVNGIGSILTRKGEGLLGFNYKLAGPVANPTISVNPLSLLTPGMFREIFRQPVPKTTR